MEILIYNFSCVNNKRYIDAATESALKNVYASNVMCCVHVDTNAK